VLPGLAGNLAAVGRHADAATLLAAGEQARVPGRQTSLDEAVAIVLALDPGADPRPG